MKIYTDYQLDRWKSYMTIETGRERQNDLLEVDFDQTAEQGVEKILAADDGLLKEAIYAATGQKDIKGGMLFSLFRRGGNAKAAGIKQDIGLESEHAFTARMRTLKEGGWVVQGRSNSFTLEPKTRNQIIREAEKLIRKHLDDPGSMPDARKELPRHYLQAVSSYTAAASESKTNVVPERK